MEFLRPISGNGLYRLGLAVTILLLSLGFLAKKSLDEQWNRALLFRSYTDFGIVRGSVALSPTVKPGTSMHGDSRIVTLSGSAWAHLRNNSVKWISGTEVFCEDKVIAVSGDRATKLFKKIGYPDRIVSATNGADLIYFVGPNSEFLLRVIAIENFSGELILYRFTIGTSGDSVLLLGTK